SWSLTRNLICRLSFLFSPINPTSYCSFFNRTSKHLNVFLLSTFYHAFSVVASSIFGTQITLVFAVAKMPPSPHRSEEHTSELQSRFDIVCRLLLVKKHSQ